MTLAWPWLLLLWPAPWLGRAMLPPAPPGGALLRWPAMTRIFGTSAAELGAPQRGRVVPWVIWTLLLLAAARPEWIDTPTGTPVSGRSLMLAMDVSASMRSANLGQEIAMAVVKRTARQFVERRHGDRVGLMLFGTRPYIQAPLTFDLRAVAQMTGEAVIGLAGESTAHGDALGLAISRLRTLEHQDRVLIMLTDGASTSGIMTVDDALKLAVAHEVRVYTIGVGVENARPGEGLDEVVLRQIAGSTGGRYFHADDAAGLEQIYVELDDLEPLAETTSQLRVATALYHWPLGAGMLVAVLALLTHPLLARRPRRG
ncbi:MAG: VWA domain-containing protein [Pseudomonadota bacterium]